MLADDLIGRIKARADDPAGRNDLPDMQMAVATAEVDIAGLAKNLIAELGLPQPEAGRPAEPQGLGAQDLAAPLSAQDIERAGAALGFAVPAALGQLYGGIADGGFGPGAGLARLAEAVAHYKELTAEPPGPGGQAWPAHLMPINLWDLGCDCLDIETGEIVYWDEEALAAGASDRVWQRSFQQRAASLAAYLEGWLASTPPDHGHTVKAMAGRMAQSTGAAIDMTALTHLKNSLEAMRRASPEDRAKLGLPAENWEEPLCEQLGLDPQIYLALAKVMPSVE